MDESVFWYGMFAPKGCIKGTTGLPMGLHSKMALEVKKFDIKGLFFIKSDVHKDDRGYFMESYKESAFAEFGLPAFAQDNISFSKKSVLRGLHFQIPPKAQGKLIRCLEGRIWDIAVDIRESSPTYGKWQGVELDATTGEAFFIPQGFAHGFVVLSEIAFVLYKTTAEYAPELERGIVWNDLDLKIKWPVKEPILSARDANFPKFKKT